MPIELARVAHNHAHSPSAHGRRTTKVSRESTSATPSRHRLQTPSKLALVLSSTRAVAVSRYRSRNPLSYSTFGTIRPYPPACTRRSRSAARVVGRGAGTDKWLVLGFIVHGGTRKPDLAIPEQQGRGDGRRGGAHVSAGHENRSCRFKVFAKLHVCPSAWCHWEAVQISAAQEREGCEVVTRRST